MAYWVELVQPCTVAGCPRRATVEVFLATNVSLGRYCKIHGRIRLHDLRSSEAVAQAKASRAGSLALCSGCSALRRAGTLWEAGPLEVTKCSDCGRERPCVRMTAEQIAWWVKGMDRLGELQH